jgi:hypothetical protein
VIGFAGVVWLIGGTVGFGPWRQRRLGDGGLRGANVCYTFGAHYSHRRLQEVTPLTVATGSQLAAAVMLLPFTVWLWPAKSPSRKPGLPPWDWPRRGLHIARLRTFLRIDGAHRLGKSDGRAVPDSGIRRAMGRAVPA